jgi:putative endonuclease
MYYVYVLRSKYLGKLYKGLTNNLERRLFEHNHGKVESTKSLLPVELVYVELCSTRNEARTIEKLFKSGWGREILKEIIE